ncbi:MAG: glycosyl hydrolase 115 family protein [Prevotella sp.]|nr:glycosyl hydrolase 115 family protein [Prevotella sp.]
MKRILILLFTFHFSLFTSYAEVVWFDGQHPITYSMPKKVESVVKIALEMWKDDMRQVTGMMPVTSNKATIKIVQVSDIPTDGFRIYIKGGQIIIEGSNGRGMAYGLLELSRLAGVSPWIWWGDVVPEKKDRLVMSDDFITEQSPSVEYRGIFLNDEDWSLRPWSSKNYEPSDEGSIGIKTYQKIFELLLRLRANTIWPAMHPGTMAFFKIPGAKAMADSCGIVIGTSHCEPLLRNNVDEWDIAERGDFNYRTNREAVHQYWIERLQEVKKSKDNMFTIGMRGIHDSSMEGYKTEQEKFDGLQQVINDQQELLRKYIDDPTKLMQVFVPYKEVLQLYEGLRVGDGTSGMKGLQVPDYVTLMWCDDNYGYMTRLSNAEEQKRIGGGGVYYHLSYWGRPHDYLWLTTTQPGLVYNEMRQAYDHNVRKLWIVNVHDVKVAGYDLELFLDMAWNIDCVKGNTLNDHYQSWLCREFGQEVGMKLFPVMHEFYQLCGIRRPEFMGWNQVEVDKKLYDRGLSQVRNSDWTQEQCDWFEGRFAALSHEVEEIGKSVRPDLADAYFAAIKYPVQTAAAQCEKMLEAQRARLFANGSTRSDIFENQDELRLAVARSYAAYDRIHQLTDYYNNQMAGGKWKNLMCDHPRDLPVFWAPLTPVVSEKIEMKGVKITEKKDCPFTSVNACDYTSASDGAKIIQMLGHSMKAVALPKDGSLTYRFDMKEDGEYMLQTALIPTQPNDNGDLRYSVSIDDQEPVVFNLKEPFRSEEWKQNVLRGQALRQQKVSLSKGNHTLTIRALDAHIVVDQWSVQ